MRRARRTFGEKGFSLLEVVIATAIITVVAGLAFVAFVNSNKVVSQTVSWTTVDDTAARLAQQMVADLRQSSPSDDADLTLGPGETAVSIGFRKFRNFDPTARVMHWTSLITWTWRPAASGQAGYQAAEIDGNGRDDNGNGLVDEGYVTRTVEGAGPGGSNVTTVVAKDVLRLSMPDPADPKRWLLPILEDAATALLGNGQRNHGFLFERGAEPNDDRITVTVTAAGRLEDQTIYTRQIVETVLLRN